MANWRSLCFLISLVAAPAWGCGPFLYDNADLDRFSLLDPGILNTREWDRFLAYASPAYGQPTPEDSDRPVELVIRPGRLDEELSEGLSNLIYDYDPGTDPVTVAANEAWWTSYFLTERHRRVSHQELEQALYGPDRPGWLAPADAKYLSLLGGEDTPRARAMALAEARNLKNPAALQHRFAFWVVRSLAQAGDVQTMKVFREFSPGPAADLPLARAQGWAASVLAATDPVAARDLWVDLFVRWPELRAQTFLSLSTLGSEVWASARSPGALVAKYFLDGRDFSPETLRALAQAEKTSGGGYWTESVFYSMAEQVERESGVFALFGLVDPNEISPAGLFTGLIDEAQALAETKVVVPTRTWWLIEAYLSLFDGDSARSAKFLEKASALPALRVEQEHQTDLIAALVRMDAEKGADWSVGLQKQVLAALDWGRELDQPGHNRGLYHTVAVLVAQKELARGHNPEAALVFGLVQNGGWGNPYRVEPDDGFWSTAWGANDPVNLLMDALMTDEDLVRWKALLKGRPIDPLTARLATSSFLTDRDLTWWQAHRALRRGEGEKALALFKTVATPDEETVFPDRQFSYSLDLDPLDPASGRALRTVSPTALAGVMVRVENDAKTKPSARSLLARGEFWFSLQLTGLPLLFSQPPAVISFTNGNFEYYGYDGRDTERTTTLVGTFPLGRPAQTDAWAQRLNAFYRDEFSTLGKARAAFEAVVARHDDPEAEFKALLFLQAIDGDHYEDLADVRYDRVALARTFRSTCEDFQSATL